MMRIQNKNKDMKRITALLLTLAMASAVLTAGFTVIEDTETPYCGHSDCVEGEPCTAPELEVMALPEDEEAVAEGKDVMVSKEDIGDIGREVSAGITAPSPNRIQVAWTAKSPEYRIYFGKGSDPKNAALYRVVNPPTDSLGVVRNVPMNEVINAGIEDNTIYTVWLEKNDIFGHNCTPVKRIRTPKWDVDWDTKTANQNWWTATRYPTSVTFTILGNPDSYPGSVELYCSDKSDGSNAWYVGKFNPNGDYYTVSGLEPDTMHYFIFRKGNSYSNPYPLRTSKANVGAPDAKTVESTKATVSYKSVKNLEAKWDTFIKGPNIQEPIYVSTFSNNPKGSAVSKSVSGLYKGSAYTTYQTARVGGSFIKSGSAKFTTTNPVPGKPAITGVSIVAEPIPPTRVGAYDNKFDVYCRVNWIPPNNLPEDYVITVDSEYAYKGTSNVKKGQTSYDVYLTSNKDGKTTLPVKGIRVGYYGQGLGTPELDYSDGAVSDTWEVSAGSSAGHSINQPPKETVKKISVKSPYSFKASNKTGGSVTLSWKNGDNSLPTAILMSDAENGPYTHVTTVAKGITSYKVNGLTPYKAYYFKAYHFKKTQASSTAKTIKASTSKTTPTMLSSANVKTTGFDARWKSPYPAGEFEKAYTNVYVAASKSGPYRLAGSVRGKTALTIDKLDMAATYYVKTQDAEKTAYGYWRKSTFSSVKATTTKAVSSPVQAFRVTGTTTPGQAKIDITPAADQKYGTLVYYSESADGPWVFIKDFGKKKVSTTIADLPQQKLYFYAVVGTVDIEKAKASGNAAAVHLSKPGKVWIADLQPLNSAAAPSIDDGKIATEPSVEPPAGDEVTITGPDVEPEVDGGVVITEPYVEPIVDADVIITEAFDSGA